MPIRKIPLEVDNIYHIYNRGINKENIFLASYDYERLVQKSIFYTEEYNIQILAWSFLPNHFHLLLRCSGSKSESGLNNIEVFMRKIQQSHAMYFKSKYNKTGPVFQGRFRAKVITNNNYLYQVLHYIHNQPVHHHISTNNSNWPYSSLNDYLLLKQPWFLAEKDSLLIDVDLYPQLFENFLITSNTELDNLDLY